MSNIHYSRTNKKEGAGANSRATKAREIRRHEETPQTGNRDIDRDIQIDRQRDRMIESERQRVSVAAEQQQKNATQSK